MGRQPATHNGQNKTIFIVVIELVISSKNIQT